MVRDRRARGSVGAGGAAAAPGDPQRHGLARQYRAPERGRGGALGCVAASVPRLRRGGDEALEVGDRGGEDQDRVERRRGGPGAITGVEDHPYRTIASFSYP